MNRLLLLALFFLFSLTASAQVTFEPGYFLDNEGKRTECLIRNTDKSTNPTWFEYKLTEGSEIKLAKLEDVQEFEVLNTIHRYRRATVNLDKSPDNLKELSLSREPEYQEEQVFLRVLVEGKASLYSYSSHSLPQRFFYSTEAGAIEPLVYKKYLVNGSELKENSTYRQQLWSSLKCPSFTMEQFKNVSYKEKDLTRLFVKYNECMETAYISYNEKKEKGEFGLTAKVGVNISALTVKQKLFLEGRVRQVRVTVYHNYTTSFDQSLFPQIGAEVEYVLPSKKKKWSVFFEPTFQYYKRTYKFQHYIHSPMPYFPERIAPEDGELEINYSHIMLPIGVKHNFFLNKGSKLFLSGAVAFNLLLSPSQDFIVESENTRRSLSVDDNEAIVMPSIITGLGYKFKNKYSLEASYQISKRIVENKNWTNRYSNIFSVVVGYKIR